MSGCVKFFYETKCKSISLEDKKLQNAYKMLDKISNIMQKRLDSEPACNEKYLKSKIKSYDSKINAIFHDSCVPKEASHCICLSVILIDCVFEDR